MKVGVVLAELPGPTFDAAVSHLADVLRECQLVLVGRGQGAEVDPELADLAAALLPDLEELRDLLRRATVERRDDRVRLEVDLAPADGALLAHVQVLLEQLRHVNRRGGLLATPAPEVTELLTWMWAEIADQLHGRTARTPPP